MFQTLLSFAYKGKRNDRNQSGYMKQQFQVEHKRKRNDDSYQSGWQILGEDIMGKILQHLNIPDRIRLSAVCKSWNSVAMQNDIPSAPTLPWLVLPQAPNSKYLSFFSLSEGKVVELELPNLAQGGLFLASSKGWLIMVKEKGLNSEMFLVNPISKAIHQLPPLGTVPSFQTFLKTKEYFRHVGAAWNFLTQIVLSSPNISECMVAITFNSSNELGLCMPGDKSWSVFQVIDEDEEIDDVLFSCGVLYALVDRPVISNGVVSARTLNFGNEDNCAVELKLVVYDSRRTVKDHIDDENYQVHDNYIEDFKHATQSCLLESTNNQVLVVHQLYDVLKKLEDEYLDQDHYLRTSGSTVYTIDPESGNFLRLHNLGDQTLFLAEHGSFLSLLASGFKELEENCIHFATSGIVTLVPRRPTITREIGIFYLSGGKIQRSLPSVQFSNAAPTRFSWFSPSSW